MSGLSNVKARIGHRHTDTKTQTDATERIISPHSAVVTVVGGRCPVLSENCAQSNAPLRKRGLRQISAYNVSTVRDSEKIQL